MVTSGSSSTAGYIDRIHGKSYADRRFIQLAMSDAAGEGMGEQFTKNEVSQALRYILRGFGINELTSTAALVRVSGFHYGCAVIDELNGSMASALPAKFSPPVLCINAQGVILFNVFDRESKRSMSSHAILSVINARLESCFLLAGRNGTCYNCGTREVSCSFAYLRATQVVTGAVRSSYRPTDFLPKLAQSTPPTGRRGDLSHL